MERRVIEVLFRQCRNLLPMLALLLCTCAVQEGDLRVARIDGNTIRITARMGAFASDNDLRSAVLLRAAEETLRYHRKGFIMVDPKSVALTERFWAIDWRPRWVVADPTGPGDILIRMMSLPKGADAPPNVFDAQEIIERLNDKSGRPLS